MTEVCLPDVLIRELEDIYQGLETEYDALAYQLSFSCMGCPDNCCDSYFLHHTYAEWAYLWLGFRQLNPEKQQEILRRASTAVLACEQALRRRERPQVMCPLNEEGLCTLYTHRLLVCRTHGVPAAMTHPDGRRLTFPGCFRCQEIVGALGMEQGKIPVTERTPYLRRLAVLENDLLQGERRRYPKVGLTISQMLIKGPPVVLP
ncbi:MAG: hypothetical protein EHM86_02140 [Desulfobulbaceae bacterium]|jgi:hypothetical protein|nr:MAG: hypothetical protein EHM86_02140 [Desulfobulbaceae bacterium]